MYLESVVVTRVGYNDLTAFSEFKRTKGCLEWFTLIFIVFIIFIFVLDNIKESNAVKIENSTSRTKMSTNLLKGKFDDYG